MSSHEKALEKKAKHKHKEGKNGKCEMCGKVIEDVENNKGKNEDKELDSHDGSLEEKGRKPKKEFGAKNNDSEED